MNVSQQYQPIFRELGIDAAAVFDHPLIVPWRSLADRENCTLDATLTDGRVIRWHVKRYPVPQRVSKRKVLSPAQREVDGLKLLDDAAIPSLAIIASARLPDGRSFVITQDLAGYQPADTMLAEGFVFDRLRNALADTAAALHNAGLHHRDLYLCHFFVRDDNDAIDVRLIDVARVKKLPALLTRQRWIVKDLAQFWYSTLSLAITDQQREAWLARYMEKRGERALAPLKRAIERKVARIAKHDERLRRKQPRRNISIPKSG